MKRKFIIILAILITSTLCLAQQGEKVFSFEQLFPEAQQKQMGLHKLNDAERESLRIHVEKLLIAAVDLFKSSEVVKTQNSAKLYTGVGDGHWISKNVKSGTYMVLEDGSLWKIDPYDKIDAMLWLPISNITVIESSDGSPGYDYLLINTDDGEMAHAQYIGNE